MSDPIKAAIAAGNEVLLLHGPLLMSTMTATTTYVHDEQSVCEKPWLALLIIATIALPLSGIAGFCAKNATIAPNIVMHALSLTRDNPYIPLPPGSNTLDGVKQARGCRTCSPARPSGMSRWCLTTTGWPFGARQTPAAATTHLENPPAAVVAVAAFFLASLHGGLATCINGGPTPRHRSRREGAAVRVEDWCATIVIATSHIFILNS
jgi:hypothetical protein